jgi:hypothetical protein
MATPPPSLGGAPSNHQSRTHAGFVLQIILQTNTKHPENNISISLSGSPLVILYLDQSGRTLTHVLRGAHGLTRGNALPEGVERR